MARFNKEQMSAMAHVIAAKLRTPCANIECTECDKYGGWCTPSEMAEALAVSGYVKQDHVDNDEKALFEMAKLIAVTRGYGCKPTDQCSKCTCCRTVGCIPYDVAEELQNNNFGKGVA